MPNYVYKCCKCQSTMKMDLPISTDPKKIFNCECGYTMRRIIVPGALFPEKVGRVWAGDWYKKTYGVDMGDGARRKAQDKMQHDAQKMKAEQDGFKFTHKSRQVGGKDRIIVPDKKDD